MKTNPSNRGHFLCALSLCLLLQASFASAEDNSNLQAQSHRNMQEVDLIIKGDHIVTMDANGSVYTDAAVAVDDRLPLAARVRGNFCQFVET